MYIILCYSGAHLSVLRRNAICRRSRKPSMLLWGWGWFFFRRVEACGEYYTVRTFFAWVLLFKVETFVGCLGGALVQD